MPARYIKGTLYIRGTPAERFWAKVDKGGPTPTHRPDLGPCWLWTAHTNGKGYGRFTVTTKKLILAYRWAWEDANGPVPEGLELDHLCRTRLCVRPSHLEAVTHEINARRGRAFITHCPQGHPYDDTNTYNRLGRPNRQCRICTRIATKAWADRIRAENPKPPKTQCSHGHPWTPENIIFEKSGHTRCRICRAENIRQRQIRLRSSSSGAA